MNKEDPPIPGRLNVTDEFGYWFSGLFDGEGCFLFKNTRHGVETPKPKIRVALRHDDRAVLEYIHQQLGCGKEYRVPPNAKTHTKEAREYRVHKISDLAEVIIPLFEHYPLHTKKAHEFQLWKGLVSIRYRAQGRPVSQEERQLYAQMNAWVARSRHGEEPPLE